MSNEFLDRHIGPNEADIASMLSAIGQKSVDDVVSKTVPLSDKIRSNDVFSG
jgi:glycine dehydrogenase